MNRTLHNHVRSVLSRLSIDTRSRVYASLHASFCRAHKKGTQPAKRTDPVQTAARFALLFFPTRMMNGHDRNPVKEKQMSTNTIDTEKTATPEPGAPQPKTKR